MASSTLTWHVSTTGTKTGTAIANFFADCNTLISSYSADANFKWVVASVNSSTTPYYLVLKRKDASVGRIMVVSWSSAPANNHATILDGAPSNNAIHFTWFPAGTADTPGDLTAASGVLLGDDTGAVKCAPMGALATIYTTSYVPFYADCEAGILLCTGLTASTAAYMGGAGDLLVDTTDTEQGCSIGSFQSIASFSVNSSPPFAWVTTTLPAGGASSLVRTNYGTANTPYFMAFMPNGPWANTVVGSTDVLSKTATNQAWFVPVPLLSQIKGGGFPLQFRQFGWGPATTAAFQSYNTTGPVTAAIQLCCYTSGGASYPWVTNFKI